MSFSSELKKELSMVEDGARHCRTAELAAVFMFLGHKKTGETELTAQTELPLLCALGLMRKLLKIGTEPGEIQPSGNKRFSLHLTENDDCEELLKAMKSKADEKGRFLPETKALLSKTCCRRAFLRGCFLCAGTISDPGRSYHLEINCKTAEQSRIVGDIIGSFAIDHGLTKRNRYFSVYVKDSEAIFDLLGIMGARVALLELENTRILNSMRGNVNRQVNCETANIGKTADASARQTEDILYIIQSGNEHLLTDGLDEVARIRLDNPEATLSELAAMTQPPVGKSGINHRLRKISMIAEKLRQAEN